MSEIVLSNGSLSLGVLPELGASLSFLTYKTERFDYPVLRPTNTEKAKDANKTALFPILPFCGRIRGGSFTYWGVLRKMSRNQSGIADPIHGDGWKNTWSVKEKTDASITLALSHNKADGGYPFSYQAEIVYEIEANELRISLSVTNPAALPMPCGLGIHPFFIKQKNTHLDFRTQVVWSNDADPIFDQPYATPSTWQFDGGKPLKNAVFDTYFGGFERHAEISYPDDGITVTMTTDDLFNHVVLYAPKGKSFFCLEPATCTTNAFNLASSGVIGTGIRSIGPGQTLTGQIKIKIQG